MAPHQVVDFAAEQAEGLGAEVAGAPGPNSGRRLLGALRCAPSTLVTQWAYPIHADLTITVIRYARGQPV